MIAHYIPPSGDAPGIEAYSLSGWWRGSYAGSPWTPTASEGTSGAAGNLSQGVNPPSPGAPLNGFTPADFDGVNDFLQADTATQAALFGAMATSYTVAALFKVDAAAPSSAVFDQPYIWGDNNAGGGPIISFSVNGTKAGHYDGGWKSVEVATTVGAWHMAFLRFSGGLVELGIDSGALSSVAAGNALTTFSPLYFGRDFSGARWLDGQIMEVLCSASALSNGDRASIRSAWNARYGLSL